LTPKGVIAAGESKAAKAGEVVSKK